MFQKSPSHPTNYIFYQVSSFNESSLQRSPDFIIKILHIDFHCTSNNYMRDSLKWTMHQCTNNKYQISLETLKFSLIKLSEAVIWFLIHHIITIRCRIFNLVYQRIDRSKDEIWKITRKGDQSSFTEWLSKRNYAFKESVYPNNHSTWEILYHTITY